MQTIKIEIPVGLEIDSFDKQSGEIKLKPKKGEVTERITTFNDVLQDNGLTESEFYSQCSGLSSDEVAYKKLKLITKSLNEGWQPDWNDTDQLKYSPWFEMGGSSGFRFNGYDAWVSISAVGSRLCFKTSKLAEYAGKHFTDLYKEYSVI